MLLKLVLLLCIINISEVESKRVKIPSSSDHKLQPNITNPVLNHDITPEDKIQQKPPEYTMYDNNSIDKHNIQLKENTNSNNIPKNIFGSWESDIPLELLDDDIRNAFLHKPNSDYNLDRKSSNPNGVYEQNVPYENHDYSKHENMKKLNEVEYKSDMSHGDIINKTSFRDTPIKERETQNPFNTSGVKPFSANISKLNNKNDSDNNENDTHIKYNHTDHNTDNHTNGEDVGIPFGKLNGIFNLNTLYNNAKITILNFKNSVNDQVLNNNVNSLGNTYDNESLAMIKSKDSETYQFMNSDEDTIEPVTDQLSIITNNTDLRNDLIFSTEHIKDNYSDNERFFNDHDKENVLEENISYDNEDIDTGKILRIDTNIYTLDENNGKDKNKIIYKKYDGEQSSEERNSKLEKVSESNEISSNRDNAVTSDDTNDFEHPSEEKFSLSKENMRSINMLNITNNVDSMGKNKYKGQKENISIEYNADLSTLEESSKSKEVIQITNNADVQDKYNNIAEKEHLINVYDGNDLSIKTNEPYTIISPTSTQDSEHEDNQNLAKYRENRKIFTSEIAVSNDNTDVNIGEVLSSSTNTHLNDWNNESSDIEFHANENVDSNEISSIEDVNNILSLIDGNTVISHEKDEKGVKEEKNKDNSMVNISYDNINVIKLQDNHGEDNLIEYNNEADVHISNDDEGNYKNSSKVYITNVNESYNNITNTTFDTDATDEDVIYKTSFNSDIMTNSKGNEDTDNGSAFNITDDASVNDHNAKVVEQTIITDDEVIDIDNYIRIGNNGNCKYNNNFNGDRKLISSEYDVADSSNKIICIDNNGKEGQEMVSDSEEHPSDELISSDNEDTESEHLVFDTDEDSSDELISSDNEDIESRKLFSESDEDSSDEMISSDSEDIKSEHLVFDTDEDSSDESISSDNEDIEIRFLFSESDEDSSDEMISSDSEDIKSEHLFSNLEDDSSDELIDSSIGVIEEGIMDYDSEEHRTYDLDMFVISKTITRIKGNNLI